MSSLGRITRKAARASLPLAFAAAALAASPAHAADPAQLACVLQDFDDVERRALAPRAAQSFLGGARELAELRSAVEACGARFGWSTEAQVDASIHAAASLSAPFYAAAVETTGIDFAWLRREILAERPLIRAAAERKRDPEELGVFIRRIGPGLRPWMERNRSDPETVLALANFIVAEAVAAGSREAFTAR